MSDIDATYAYAKTSRSGMFCKWYTYFKKNNDSSISIIYNTEGFHSDFGGILEIISESPGCTLVVNNAWNNQVITREDLKTGTITKNRYNKYTGFLEEVFIESPGRVEFHEFDKGRLSSYYIKNLETSHSTKILFVKGAPYRVINAIVGRKGLYIPNGLQAVYRKKKWFIQYRVGDKIIDKTMQDYTTNSKIINPIDASMLYLAYPGAEFQWPELIQKDINKVDPRNIRFCGWKVNNIVDDGFK